MNLCSTIAVACAVLSLARGLDAQEPPAPAGPCRTAPCNIQVEWGVAGAPVTTDRRYGALAEYLHRTVSELERAGYRFKVAESNEVLTFRLRPRIVQAMCDVMPGTGTAMDCQMIADVDVEVKNPDAAVKLPATIRIRNRCGDQRLMDIIRFSEFSAATIVYELGRDQKGRRPIGKCQA